MVNLRGISIAHDGTIFSGDELQVGPKGYASVMLIGGHHLEVDSNTKITVSQAKNSVMVELKSGHVSFSSSGSAQLTLRLGPYEILPEPRASGDVVQIKKDLVGLRSLKGKITVRQTLAHTEYIVTPGQDQFLTFAGQSVAPPTQVASSEPTPVPASLPLPPQTRPPTTGCSTTCWVAILAAIGGGATAIAILATRGKNTASPSTPQ